MTTRIGIIAAMFMATMAMADGGRPAPYRATPAPVHTEAIFTIVIDLHYISAADIALLFGGGYLRGNTALSYRQYSGPRVRSQRYQRHWPQRGYRTRCHARKKG